jgi:hypothetical protein
MQDQSEIRLKRVPDVRRGAHATLLSSLSVHCQNGRISPGSVNWRLIASISRINPELYIQKEAAARLKILGLSKSCQNLRVNFRLITTKALVSAA